MRDLYQQLAAILQGRVCLVGVGNLECGDDGLGVRIVQRCAGMSGGRKIMGEGAMIASSDAVGGRNAFLPLTPAFSLLEGEDRVGPENRIKEICHPPSIETILAATAPEKHLNRLANGGFDHVLFVDATDFGGSPGTAMLLDSSDMSCRFPQVSTHKLSLGLLARLIECGGRTKVWLLGVQPESLAPGTGLTPRVRTTMELLTGLLAKAAETARARSRIPARSFPAARIALP